MEEEARKALTTQEVKEAIGRFRGVAKFFDTEDMSAESDGNVLADAIENALSALSSPRPETREEDIAEVRERIDGVIDDLANMHEGDECKAKGGAGCLACIAQDSLSEALAALSRLAAPKPEGQA